MDQETQVKSSATLLSKCIVCKQDFTPVRPGEKKCPGCRQRHAEEMREHRAAQKAERSLESVKDQADRYALTLQLCTCYVLSKQHFLGKAWSDDMTDEDFIDLFLLEVEPFEEANGFQGFSGSFTVLKNEWEWEYPGEVPGLHLKEKMLATCREYLESLR